MRGLSKIAITAMAFATIAPVNVAIAQEYKTAVVSTVKSGGSATIGGTVIPFKQVTLTAQIPGRVKFIAGIEGHAGKVGEVLVQINDDQIQAQRRAAQAQIMQAEAGVRNSRMQYSRELYAPRTNSITGIPGMGIPATFDQFFTRGFADSVGVGNSAVERQADLYARGVGIDTAQSSLLAAQAALETLDAKVRDSRAVAPFDGIVLSKMVEVGDTVQPGMPLITYAYIEYLRVDAEVPVRLAAGLQEGMIVPARLDVGGGSVDAKVAQIFPVADAARHTVRVKFDLPHGTVGGPGMYVEVTVPDGSIPVSAQPAIPPEALIWRGSLPSVFVLDEKGNPSLRLVRVGYPLPDGRVAVVSGLTGGETVILNPPASLVSGK